jgi:hypothetical protein
MMRFATNRELGDTFPIPRMIKGLVVFSTKGSVTICDNSCKLIVNVRVIVRIIVFILQR